MFCFGANNLYFVGRPSEPTPVACIGERGGSRNPTYAVIFPLAYRRADLKSAPTEMFYFGVEEQNNDIYSVGRVLHPPEEMHRRIFNSTKSVASNLR